jgi:hypothetical protein
MQGKSQSYIKFFPEYPDKYITDKIMDNLKLHAVSNFIIYQTNINSNVAIDTSLKIDTISVSYLIWKEKGRINTILVTDTLVYKSSSTIKDSCLLFNYPFLSNLWIRNDEDVYKVVPSITYPLDKDIVFYLTPDYKRFFEFGRNAYYQLNPKRNKYRKEYLSLLQLTVCQFNGKWEKFMRNEKRWWGEDSF